MTTEGELSQQQVHDNRVDGGEEGLDGRIARKGEDKQNENNHAVAIEDVFGFDGHALGQDANQDFAAIEGMDRDEIENSQKDVDADDGKKYKKQKGAGAKDGGDKAN